MVPQNKHVLVVGDFIDDHYRMFNSTRLCPEAPVPVLVRQKATEQQPVSEFSRDGGAALVTKQLKALLGEYHVTFAYGSYSVKERIFADGHLVCRIDKDGHEKTNRQDFYDNIRTGRIAADLIVVSDYGKGGMDAYIAAEIINWSQTHKVPVLVDAKTNWSWYEGAFAFFPNRHESTPVPCHHLIQKLGPEGCSVDGVIVPPDRDREVRDVTGAGDIFIAAFASSLVSGQLALIECAKFANHVAGLSVTHIGTHVVTKLELDRSK